MVYKPSYRFDNLFPNCFAGLIIFFKPFCRFDKASGAGARSQPARAVCDPSGHPWNLQGAAQGDQEQGDLQHHRGYPSQAHHQLPESGECGVEEWGGKWYKKIGRLKYK